MSLIKTMLSGKCQKIQLIVFVTEHSQLYQTPHSSPKEQGNHTQHHQELVEHSWGL